MLACAPDHPLATAGAGARLEACVAYPWITPLRGTPLRNALEARLHQMQLAAPLCA